MNNPVSQASLTVLSLFLATSCSALATSPEDVYNRFWTACNEGDTATAESLATEAAVDSGQPYGVCIHTHDGFARFNAGFGFDFENEEPQVDISGDTAYLSWQTTVGKTIRITLYKSDGAWKIQEGRIFD